MNRAPAFAQPHAPVRLKASPQRVWRWLFLIFGGLLLAAMAVWLLVMGLPQRMALDLAQASARAGLAVRQVELSGIRHQSRLEVYDALLSGGSDALILVRPADVRARLLELPWVLDADVRRRWPDTLVVTIVERQPIAIWQAGGRYRLIDGREPPLPWVEDERFRALPLVVGVGADAAAPGLLRLLADHPRLSSSLVGATRVGGRRWDLLLTSGEIVSLPEDPAARPALARFTAADSKSPLLGQGFVRIDLRIPGQMAIRLSPEAREAAEKRAREEARRRQMPAAGTLGVLPLVQPEVRT
jgi:cell division protein FtsQ